MPFPKGFTFAKQIGINLTGMYANPIVAWALTFNCGDVCE
jgi:hypothetical protein